MLAQSKENGVKLGIDNLSKNINKIEETIKSIAQLEQEKPHPDPKFNVDKELAQNDKNVGVIESKMDDIKRFYVNLREEDDKIEVIESELAGIKDSIKKNKNAIKQTQKEISEKHNKNVAVGAVSDDEWNKGMDFILNAPSE